MQIVGPAYIDRSLEYSAQSTVNLYPSRPIEGRSVRKLHRWPGAKLWSSSNLSGRGRSNLIEMGGKVYFVVGANFASVDKFGVQASLGSVAGDGYCNLSTDGTNVIVSNGTNRYTYDGTTYAEISDTDHQPGNTSTFINRRIIMDGNGGAFLVADLDDPDSINSLNFATAESAPDDTIAVRAFKERLLVFGEQTVEPWFNDGSPDFPPYSRIEGATQQFGLGAVHSLAQDESFVYLLGSNRQIYRMVDIEAQRITPVPMEKFLEDEVTSDAIGWTISYSGQWFYILSFPTANKTWGIPLSSPNDAFQLTSDLDGGSYVGAGYVYAFGRHLVLDGSTSNIYELKEGVYQDNGSNVLVERALAPLNAEAFGLTGEELCMSQFQLIMETGVGNDSELDPVGLFDFSTDGGASFTNEKWVKLGREGIKKTVVYSFKKKFRDGVVRFRVVDPVNVSLHSASAKVKLAGGLK